MSGPCIHVERVSKQFRLDRGHRSIREAVGYLFRRREPEATRHRFNALKDVTFSASAGEALGIIGPNGAGKSTILKLLVGILRPDSGRITVAGRSAAMIEVGAGFHGDLTGRENIFLNGAVLGMRRGEIRAKLDAIVAFAGIERFLDMPVKRYSSGMHARLGFAIAIHTEPRVLLIDEVLSVGDAVYRVRCLERMRMLVAQGVTLILVTHDLEQMQSVCRRAIVLDAGAISYDGPAASAASEYLTAMTQAPPGRPGDILAERLSHAVQLRLLRVRNSLGEEISSASPTELVNVELQLHLQEPIEEVVVELNLHRVGRGLMMSLNSSRDEVAIRARGSGVRVTVELARIPLCAGRYLWNVRTWRKCDGALLLDTPLISPFAVEDVGINAGVVAAEREWRIAPIIDGSTLDNVTVAAGS